LRLDNEKYRTDVLGMENLSEALSVLQKKTSEMLPGKCLWRMNCRGYDLDFDD